MALRKLGCSNSQSTIVILMIFCNLTVIKVIRRDSFGTAKRATGIRNTHLSQSPGRYLQFLNRITAAHLSIHDLRLAH